MSHVDTHCGTISKTNPTKKIPIFIHDGTRLNLALGLKRQKGQTDSDWAKDRADLKAMKEAMYKRFKRKGDKVYYHKPSYTHPEPPE